MRNSHGSLPRNPYNMIIQENHVADRATLIIPYLKRSTRNHYKEIDYAANPINHNIRE